MINSEQRLRKILEERYDLQGESLLRLLELLKDEYIERPMYVNNINEIFWCKETNNNPEICINNLINFLTT